MKFDYKKIVDEVFSNNFWPRFLITVIGAFVLAVNFNLFLLHNHLVIGGSTGIATIVHKYTGLAPATFIFIFNCVFIIISFIFLGPRSTGLTLVGALIYPIFISLTSNMCEYLATKIVLDDFMLVVLISGVLYGTANGFIYKAGFTTGGTDILIQLINKYLKIPTGMAALFTNVIIIIAGGLIFGPSQALYAIVIIVISSFLVDKIMLGISDSKMFYIYTKKSDEVKDFITQMNTGYTIMKTEGGYTSKDNHIIMCVLSTKDYYMFKNVVQKIDPNAFFIITDCYEVYGGHRKQKFPFI